MQFWWNCCLCKKNTVSKGVSKLRNAHSDIQWIKLDKSFFSLEKDLYLASVYIVHLNVQLGMYLIQIQSTLLYWRVYRCITSMVICSYKVTLINKPTLILVILFLAKVSIQRWKGTIL